MSGKFLNNHGQTQILKNPTLLLHRNTIIDEIQDSKLFTTLN